MKKWIWILVIVVALILFGCQKGQKTETADIAESVETVSPIAGTIDSKLSACLEQFEQGEAMAGVLELLDTVELTRPANAFPAGFMDLLDNARENFQSDNYQAGVSQVMQARQLFESSSEIEISLGVDSSLAEGEQEEQTQIAPVAAMIKEKVETARMEFKAGNADKGVIIILKAVELLAPQPSGTE